MAVSNTEQVRDGTRKRPGRRTATEVRELLISSARELFSTQGYAGTSTRDIARVADVSEALLFRHFGTKAKLFEKAILEPFDEFLSGYVKAWGDRSASPHSPDVPSRQFIDGLYRVLRQNRELVMAALAAHAFEDDVAKDVGGTDSSLAQMLEQVEDIVHQEADYFGFRGLDIPVTTRVAFAMVMGMAVFNEWLFPPGKRKPSEARVIEEMTAFLVHGVGHRPPQ
jgi:AcrR family transcriptional regulator